MIKKYFFAACCVLLAVNITAQSKMNFSLAKEANNTETNKDEIVAMFIQGDVAQIKVLVEGAGGHFKYASGNIASVNISINQLSSIISDPAIKRVEAFPPQVKPLSDSVLCNSNVYPVHYGQAPLPQSYDGAGVIIGFIDYGIDFTHPDFQDSAGHSRILWLWDQSKLPNVLTPGDTSYSYGQQWSNTDIDNGLCTHDPSAAFGHGTHVAGIAAGNGLATGGYLGTAPAADIIAVYATKSIGDAVYYIYSKALAAGKPCVINASVGNDFGSHDGKDDLETMTIDSLIKAQPGRAFVAAAGNSGNAGAVHLTYTVSPVDTNFTFFSPASGVINFNIVADSNSLKNIKFAIGADKMAPSHSFRGKTPFSLASSFPLRTWVQDSLVIGGNRIGNYYVFFDKFNGDYRLQYWIEPDSLTYYWRLMATGTGSFDLWNYDNNYNYHPIINSGLPLVATMPDSVFYKFPDTDKSIEGGFQCLNSVITVANYINRRSYTDCNGNPYLDLTKVPGQRASSSSIGPTRDGRIKPDIAAPGEVTMAAVEASTKSAMIGAGQQYNMAQGCSHVKSSGTSNACPGVAGIAALYLQKNPTATAAQVKQAIINSAFQDVYTGAGLPDNHWGAGKVDALATLTGTLAISKPHDTTVCENNDASFTVTYNGTGLTYQWQVDQGSGFIDLINSSPYSGVTTHSLTVTAAPYSLNNYKYRCVINNCSTCVKSLPAATLTVNPAPDITNAAATGNVCSSTSSQTTLLTYSATSYTPTTYSIAWNATAISNGFSAVTNAVLPASTITITVPANAIATAYTGTITVKTALGCSSISGNNFTVSVDSLPFATAGGATTICSGSSATVAGATAGNGTILWTANGTGSITSGASTLAPVYTSSSGDAGNTVTLTMTVSATNACGTNTRNATYALHVNSLPVVSINGLASSYCYNASSHTLSASPAGGVYSGTGITDVTNGVFSPVTAGSGTYTITYSYTDNNGCSNTAAAKTVVLTQPTVPDSCTSTTGVGTITRAEPTPDTISVNVFTPNDDGINDVFIFDLKSASNSASYSGTNYGNYIMNIYNRWGDLIYFSYSPNVGWDGTSMAGVKVSAGTYYYTVSFNGSKYNGHISLMR